MKNRFRGEGHEPAPLDVLLKPDDVFAVDALNHG
jgi:hypothetical protein